jgi:hypothetical protein
MRWWWLIPAATAALWLGSAVSASASNQVAITSSGPMTGIYLTRALACQVTMASDAGPAFSGGTDPGACGTFMQLSGGNAAVAGGANLLFGPDLSVVGGPSNASYDFTPVGSQTVSGTGTPFDPFQVTTTVAACAPATGSSADGRQGDCAQGQVEVAKVAEFDSYVVGEDQYNTALVVDNESGSAISGTVYHAGDCSLTSDQGYGALDGTSGSAPACATNPNDSPPGRVMSFRPVSGKPVSYYEGADFWSYVTSDGAPYPDSVAATSKVDNGIGLSWAYSLAPGASTTIAYDTVISPNQPPVNLVLPGITGTAAVGQTLSCTQGSWTNAAPITYTYQWLENGSALTGATDGQYTIQSADAGSALSCQVTANTADGSTSATSAPANVSLVPVVPSVAPGPPSVAPGPPTVRPIAAALAATVNPNGADTTVYFEYGLDPRYGLTTASNLYVARTPTEDVGSGSAPVPVAANVTGLVPNALYHYRVVAMNGQGTTTSADETFTTLSLSLPTTPVLGVDGNFIPVSGVVYVKVPGQASGVAGASPTAAEGKGFVPLTQPRQLPVGTVVDARHGQMKLTTATTVKRKGKRTKTQTGDFSRGLFVVKQSKQRKLKGLTDLVLLDNGIFPGAPNYKAECATVGKSTNGSLGFKPRHLSKKVINTLTANEHGSYTSSGKYSAATVRGTIFTVTDRCDATVTKVKRGEVTVTVYRRPQRPVTLRTGQSYTAKAP